MSKHNILFSYFLFEKSNDANPIELATAVLQVLTTFGYVYLYCEFGECVTHDFEVLNQKLTNRQWYLFPIEMQRVFLITLPGTQQSVVVKGYADTQCTREAFKSVIICDDI